MGSKAVIFLVVVCACCGVQCIVSDSPDFPLQHSASDWEHSIPSMLHETGVFIEEDGSLMDAHQWLQNDTNGEQAMNFLELSSGVEKVHGYCEICVRMLQMYQRGLPDVCAGLTDTFFISCVKNLESILKADRAMVYWHQVGCIHNDQGPEIVKPCPAHVICGWVPNIFARRTGIAAQIGQLAPLCPRDINYLPRVPRTLAPGGLPGS